MDIYGKYFVNRRNGVSFNAGGHYDLDAVTSSVIRVGARYTAKSSKWKFYAGAAYEHELDGKAGGTANQKLYSIIFFNANNKRAPKESRLFSFPSLSVVSLKPY